MMVLKCQDCNEVMHTVPQATEQSRQAGIVQLAQHVNEMHVMPALEKILAHTAGMVAEGTTYDELKEMLRVRCPECSVTVREDSYHLVRVGNRTLLCCSARCLKLTQQKAQM